MGSFCQKQNNFPRSAWQDKLYNSSVLYTIIMQQNPNNPNQNTYPANQDPQNPQVNPSNQTYINTAPLNSTSSTAPNIANKSDSIEKIIQLIWYVVGFVNVILVLRIIFLLFNAQPSGFSSFLYGVTNPFAMPFFGIFPAPAQGKTYFDTAALVAIIIYSLIAWGVVTLIRIIADKKQVA